MTDDKDLEIARLKGRLEAAEQRRGGVVGPTLKVVLTLLAIPVVVILVLALVGTLGQLVPEPDPAVEAARINAYCESQYAGYAQKVRDECRFREFRARAAD